MDTGETQAGQVDALQPLWAGLDLGSDIPRGAAQEPEKSLIIERFTAGAEKTFSGAFSAPLQPLSFPL